MSLVNLHTESHTHMERDSLFSVREEVDLKWYQKKKFVHLLEHKVAHVLVWHSLHLTAFAH